MPASTTAPLLDVVIVGGGPAGLSAAIVLARSRRSVAVVDAGEPRNAPAHAAHNVFSRDGASPLALLADARAQAEGYGVRILPGRAVDARHAGDSVEVMIDATPGDSAAPGDPAASAAAASGPTALRARRLLLATGLRDELPALPGLHELWGRDVVHCPFCHGWEVRDRPIVVLGRGERNAHQALLFSALSDEVAFLEDEGGTLPEETAADLRAVGVRIVAARATRLLAGPDGSLRAVELDDGRELPAEALVVAPAFLADTALYERLGGEAVEQPGVARSIPADPVGRTPVPRVWAVGNAADPMAMVASAAAAGVTTGAQLHAELLREEVAAARGRA